LWLHLSEDSRKHLRGLQNESVRRRPSSLPDRFGDLLDGIGGLTFFLFDDVATAERVLTF